MRQIFLSLATMTEIFRSGYFPSTYPSCFLSYLVLALAGSAFLAENSQAAPKKWLPEGFHLQTFAEPPEVTYPTGLSVSPLGEVFVSVDLNSSIDRKPNRGKIVRCVDTDGDGKADKFTDFVPNIDSPRGSCFVGDTLYIINPPYLSAFRDRDGDGVADEKVQLIKGLGFDLSFRGADHTSNGARMGIDGWLYLAIGDYGFTNAVARDGSSLYLQGGGVVRVRPDGSELEFYSLYTRNICDVGVSPALDVFARDNTNDGKGWNTRLHHFISLANHGYPRLYQHFNDEILQPLADYGGGSGTGAYWLDEPGFPEKFNDVLYTCDFTTRHVYLHSMEKTEATFRAQQEPFFSIQAIDMDADGFSRIYVNDWEGGGYTYQNPKVGSISLITYPSLPAAVFPDLEKATEQALLRHMVSPSAVCRLNTQREILKRGPTPTLGQGLERLATDRSVSLYGRIAALFTLKQLLGPGSHDSLLTMTDDPSIREFALRALADRKSQLDQVPTKPFVTGLSDSNPRVRLQSIIGLARLGQDKAAPQILALIQPSATPPALTPKQGRYDHNQVIPHIGRKALVDLQATEACLEALDSPAMRHSALLCLQEIHSSPTVDGLIQKLQHSSDPELKAAILKALFRLYHVDKRWDAKGWWSTRPDDRGPYFTPVTWEQSAKIQRAVKDHIETLPLEMQTGLLTVMRRNRIDPGSWNLKAVGQEILSLVESPHLNPEAIAPLKQAALSDQQPETTRIAAFHALGRIDHPQVCSAQLEILAGWHQSNPSHARFAQITQDFVYSAEHAGRADQIRNATRQQRDYARQVALMICLNLSSSPLTTEEVKQVALDALKNQQRRPEFIRAVGEMGSLEYRETVEKAAQSDRHELALAAKESLTRLDQASAVQPQKETSMVADLSLEKTMVAVTGSEGNIDLGKQLFSRQGCIACHTVSPDQPLKGPFLGDAGNKWQRTDLVQSILQPNAVVAQGFQTQWFETKDEFVYEGFVTSEKDGEIEVRNVAGIITRIPAEDVAKRGLRKNSMMPEGLAANLNLHELASLVAYLQSLKTN